MYKVQQNEAKAYEKLSGNLDMDISIMINSKQRRHIHEKWQFGQGGPGVAQGVPRGGKSLGGAGGRGEGRRGMGTKTTYPLVALQITEAVVSGSNPASLTVENSENIL